MGPEAARLDRVTTNWPVIVLNVVQCSCRTLVVYAPVHVGIPVQVNVVVSSNPLGPRSRRVPRTTAVALDCAAASRHKRQSKAETAR